MIDGIKLGWIITTASKHYTFGSSDSVFFTKLFFKLTIIIGETLGVSQNKEQ
jgi:hypothetical protein